MRGGNDVMVVGMTAAVGGRMRGGNDVMVVGMMAAVGGRMRGGNDVMVMGMTRWGGRNSENSCRLWNTRTVVALHRL